MDAAITSQNDVWSTIGKAVQTGISSMSDAYAQVIRSRATPSGTQQVYSQQNPLPGTLGNYPQAQVKPGALEADMGNVSLSPMMMLGLVAAVLVILALRR